MGPRAICAGPFLFEHGVNDPSYDRPKAQTWSNAQGGQSIPSLPNRLKIEKGKQQFRAPVFASSSGLGEKPLK